MCWKIKDGKEEFKNFQEYTKFFKSHWDLKDEKWNFSEQKDAWTRRCDNSEGIGWVILGLVPDNGTHHLGLCTDKEVSSTNFVKKVQKPWGSTQGEIKDKWALWACESNCWKTDVGALMGSTITLQEENENNWKEIQFYKNTKNI